MSRARYTSPFRLPARRTIKDAVSPRLSNVLALFLWLGLPLDAADLKAAQRLHKRGSLSEARVAYLAALPELRSAADPRPLGDALHALGQIASAAGDYAASADYARESAAIFTRLGDPSGEARAFLALGAAELYRGNYPAAGEHFRRALDRSRVAQDGEREITCLNNLGNVFYFEGRYLEAFRYYQAALARVEQTRGEPANAHARQVTTTNLATLYQRLGRRERALDLYLEASDAASTALSPREQAQRLANLGVLYHQLGDPYKALDSYQAALRLLERERFSDAELGVRKNLGILRTLELADYAAAQQDFRAVLDLAARASNRREDMVARLFLGEALRRLGRAAEARTELDLALTAARSLGAAPEQWMVLYTLARLSLAERDAAGARRRLEEAIGVIESLRSGAGLASLRSEFLADKREVYDARIALALDSGQPLPVLFEWMERARSRSFQDRVRLPRAPLSAVQSRLAPGTLLLSCWTGQGRLALLWAMRDSAGLLQSPFPSDAARRVPALLDALARGSGEEWRDCGGGIGMPDRSRSMVIWYRYGIC